MRCGFKGQPALNRDPIPSQGHNLPPYQNRVGRGTLGVVKLKRVASIIFILRHRQQFGKNALMRYGCAGILGVLRLALRSSYPTTRKTKARACRGPGAGYCYVLRFASSTAVFIRLRSTRRKGHNSDNHRVSPHVRASRTCLEMTTISYSQPFQQSETGLFGAIKKGLLCDRPFC